MVRRKGSSKGERTTTALTPSVTTPSNVAAASQPNLTSHNPPYSTEVRRGVNMIKTMIYVAGL